MVKGVTERMIKKYIQLYFFDQETKQVYRRSESLNVGHRRCVTKSELIQIIKKNHETDHRKNDTIYETIRHAVFPVGRETIKILFKNEITCTSCNAAVELPKTTRTRRPIPATYPNSRWQIDLKKMPCYKGFNYVCNILDCYSRFAFGCATKTKTAKEIADVVLKYIYLYGAPRILQSDNGKEFTNKDLEGVVEEFKSKQIHGRPYHPQSQGRVERFNRTMTTFFRVKMSTVKDWVEELPHFYYTYNNRVNSIPYQNLTEEERLFLRNAHLDVDGEEENECESSTENNDQEKIVDTATDGYDEQLSLEETLQLLEDIASPTKDITEDQTNEVNTQQDCIMKDKTPEKNIEINLTSENVQSCQVLLIEEKENEVVQNNTASPYYSEMYRKRFGRPPSLISSESPSKRIHLQEINGNQSTFFNTGITQYFDSEQMYPVELFSKNSLDDITSYIYYNEAVPTVTNRHTSYLINTGNSVTLACIVSSTQLYQMLTVNGVITTITSTTNIDNYSGSTSSIFNSPYSMQIQKMLEHKDVMRQI
ncbi:Hypothetical predicted protein [Mytilus galloprovincialis]|uniref:Integrase catalytic domain-containing protein n=1 Tax=Mytilus galloprovincialis TaxID=29158 RepID=A0A8B6GIS3_MYTGA|nr:Hypothetical predicted protein [Mytilus galloprovincialis]